jgi:hypothetical protein
VPGERICSRFEHRADDERLLEELSRPVNQRFRRSVLVVEQDVVGGELPSPQQSDAPVRCHHVIRRDVLYQREATPLRPSLPQHVNSGDAR